MKKTVKKIIASLIVIGIICSLAVIAVNAYMIGYAKKYILSYDDLSSDSFDCIMILGAGLWSGSPSPMLSERLEFGLKAYETGCSDRMLMSGDHGQDNYDEVNTMKDYLADEGVDRDIIFMDHAGFSTYESMYRARDIFEVKKMLIVTQTYHLYRAVYNARKLGLDAYGFEADRLSYPIYNHIRECAARVKDFVWCIVKPKPTYLGDKIPISGSASLSDDR